MDKQSAMKLMANWPTWMQDYRLTSNSPQRISEPVQTSVKNNKKVLVPS